jgi:hypothetical protein
MIIRKNKIFQIYYYNNKMKIDNRIKMKMKMKMKIKIKMKMKMKMKILLLLIGGINKMK